jgi:hypothetical protein
VRQRELCVHLRVPATSLGALVTSLGVPRITVEESGKEIFFGNAAGAPGSRQVYLEIIATTYRSTIVKTQVFRLYSHLRTINVH